MGMLHTINAILYQITICSYAVTSHAGSVHLYPSNLDYL